jgi:hypothetical protein
LGLRRDYSYHFSYHADRLRTGGKLSASISSIEPANGGVVSSGSDSLNVPSVLRSLRLLPARPPVPSSVVSVPAGGPVRPRPSVRRPRAGISRAVVLKAERASVCDKLTCLWAEPAGFDRPSARIEGARARGRLGDREGAEDWPRVRSSAAGDGPTKETGVKT